MRPPHGVSGFSLTVSNYFQNARAPHPRNLNVKLSSHFPTRLALAKKYAILSPMFRRAQALLVILALFATPMALLARAATPDSCDGMCCMPHASHSSPMHHTAPAASKSDADCQHSELTCAMECSMKSGHTQFNFGLLAPIAPTKPSPLASIAPAQNSKPTFAAPHQIHLTDFASSPFQPPRQ